MTRVQQAFDIHQGVGSVVRRFVTEHAGLDPVRSAEAAILTSELVTAAVVARHDSLDVSVERTDTSVSIRVESDGDIAEVLDDRLVAKLFSEIAVFHLVEEDGQAVRFDIRPPGANAALRSLDDDALIDLARVDPVARTEVMERFDDLAVSIAKRYRRKGVAGDDLDQVARLGLLKALSRFEPAKGAFPAYASATISGELKRQLRDRGWSLRVPRSLQEMSMEVSRAAATMAQRLGRRPTVSEIADELDMSIPDVVEARAAHAAYWSRSLDAPATPESPTRLAALLIDPEPDVLETGQWADVSAAVRALPERERTIVYLRFFEDQTQTEIAEAVGISQMHVSRLLNRSLDAIRESLG